MSKSRRVGRPVVEAIKLILSAFAGAGTVIALTTDEMQIIARGTAILLVAGAVALVLEYLMLVQESKEEKPERADIEQLGVRIERANKEGKSEVVTKIEDLESTVERLSKLEEQRAKAGVTARAKWWLFGMDDDT